MAKPWLQTKAAGLTFQSSRKAVEPYH